MRHLQLVAAVGLARVPNGHSGQAQVEQFRGFLLGDTHRDSRIIEILSHGGAAQNTVSWLPDFCAYAISGRINSDPNLGDTPEAIKHRLQTLLPGVRLSHRIVTRGVVDAEGAPVNDLLAMLFRV